MRNNPDAAEIEISALHRKLDAIAENFAQCRKGHDELRLRAEAAEAGAAAMRLALEDAVSEIRRMASEGSAGFSCATIDAADAAIADPTGVVLLERSERMRATLHEVVQLLEAFGYADVPEGIVGFLTTLLERLRKAEAELSEQRHASFDAVVALDGALSLKAAALQARDEAIKQRDDLIAAVERLKQSMAAHFQRDHLAGDGPEIDRWKAKVETLRGALEAVRDALMELSSWVPSTLLSVKCQEQVRRALDTSSAALATTKGGG